MYPVPIWAPILSKPDPSLTLDLRFAADGAYFARRGPLPTFTRALATATFVGSNGLIQSAGADVPRIDYNPATLECIGLLLEEQRTNITPYSQDFTNPAWTKVNVTAAADATTSPSGAVDADVISETTTSGQHYINAASVSVVSGTTYTFSVFVKKGITATAPDWISFLLFSGAFGTRNVAFNLTTGLFGAVAGSSFTYSVEQYQNGWWRVSITAAAIATGVLGGVYICFTNNANAASAPTYAGQTTSSVFAWGAQFETGAFATSYIPTTTASVTRNADACSISGANFTSFWNQSEGTLVLDMIKSYTVPVATAQINHLTASDGTLNNYIQFAQRSAGTTGEVFRCEVGGLTQAVFAGGPLNAINTPFRIGGAYKLNDFASAINGSDCSTDTAGTTPSVLNQLQFPVVFASNHIRSLQYYNVRKTNTELTRLTRLPTLDPALTLDMQFALDASYFSRLGPLPTFTNASTTRTFVGSDGLIKIAASNVPRIDFDPVTRLCRGLLIEEQRANSQTRSEEFGNASWAKGAVTVTDNSSTAPDGATTADLISETTANAQHTIYQSSPAGVTTGTVYTASVFVKKGTGATAPDWVQLGFLAGGFGGSFRAAFNVSTGLFGNITGSVSPSVTAFSNGWYRISVTATATVTAAWGTIIFALTNNTNTSASIPTYTGQTTSDVFIWGAQFEAGAFATSYIPTTTTSLIRSADVCSITGAAFTGFYNQTEGSIVFKGAKQAVQLTVSPTYVSVDDATAGNRILMFGGTNESFSVNNGGVAQAFIASTLNASAFALFGMCSRYKLNDIALSANGASVVTDTSATIPTNTQMSIGSRVNSSFMCGWIQAVQYYNTIKTNAQLQALSTP